MDPSFSKMTVKLHVTLTVHKDLDKVKVEAGKVVDITKVRSDKISKHIII